MPASSVVSARVDSGVREQAEAVLDSYGLTTADAIRLLLNRIAQDNALPAALSDAGATDRSDGGDPAWSAEARRLIQEAIEDEEAGDVVDIDTAFAEIERAMADPRRG